MDGDRALQALTTAIEHRDLGALYVDLQHVQCGEVVEPTSCDRQFLLHGGPFREAVEPFEDRQIWLEKAGHARDDSIVQGAGTAVANHAREIGLQIALAGIEGRQPIRLGLEPGDRAKPPAEHRFVGGVAVDRIGPDVHHGGQPLRT